MSEREKKLYQGLLQEVWEIEDDVLRKESLETVLSRVGNQAQLEILQSCIQDKQKELQYLHTKKNMYQNEGELVATAEVREELKQTKRLLKDLRELKDAIQEQKQETIPQNPPVKREKREVPTLPIALERIEALDEARGLSTQPLLALLQNRLGTDAELSKLQTLYEKTLSIVKKEYKKALDDNDTISILKCQKEKRIIHHVLVFISAQYKCQNKLKNKHLRLQKRTFADEEMEKELSEEEKRMIKLMTQGRYIPVDSHNQFTKLFCYYIRNYPVTPQFLPYFHVWIEPLINISENKEVRKNRERLFRLGEDAIRSKRKKVSKENVEEKRFLKVLCQKIDFYGAYYHEEEPINTYDPYYDIMLSMIEDPKYFDVLKEAVTRIPKLAKAHREERTILNNEDSPVIYKHIFEEIIDRYIKNYKLEMRGQNLDYISPHFYKDVLDMLLNSGRLHLKKDAASHKRIEYALEQFKQYIEKCSYIDRSSALEIKREVNVLLEAIRISYLYIPEEEYPLEAAAEELACAKRNFSYLIMSRGRYDLTTKCLDSMKEKLNAWYANEKIELDSNERRILRIYETPDAIEGISPTASFQGNQLYNISYTYQGLCTFQMHVPDYEAAVPRGGSLEDYLYNRFCLQKENDFRYTGGAFDLKMCGREMPAVTYQISITPKGKIRNFKAYRSKVYLNEVYDDVYGYDTVPTFKHLINLAKRLNMGIRPKTKKEVDDIFSGIINQQKLVYTRRENLPILAKGTDKENEMICQNLHIALCDSLHKIDKEDLKKLLALLEEQSMTETYAYKDYPSNYSVLEDGWNGETVFNQTVLVSQNETEIMRLTKQAETMVKEVNATILHGMGYQKCLKKGIDKRTEKTYDGNRNAKRRT